MKKPKSRHASSPARRAGILRAALACFTESGIAGSSIGGIQGRAGVSIGSLYHHFKSKENLAAALYLEGIRNYQEGFAPLLGDAMAAREGIRAIVRYHLAWVKKNRDWARFLFHERHADFMGDADGEIATMNRDFIDGIAHWVAGRVEAGELRPITPDLFACMILGPCQEFSRLYLSGARVTPVERAVREIGECVWRALSAAGESHAAQAQQSK